MPPLLLLQDVSLRLGAGNLLDGASLGVGSGDRVALVGRNGSGKSTLLRIAAGEIAPDAGTRFLQPGTTLRHLPQEPDLGGFATVEAYAADGLGPGDDPHRVRLLLDRLGLPPGADPARLSGGEERRAALARALAPSPDLLLLDEPTNHLDLPAIEWLEEELAALPCGLVLISHDRRLLTRLAREVVWLEAGRTRRLARGFGEFEAWRDAALDEEATEVHRLERKIAREEDWLRYGVTARRKRNQRRLADLQGMRAQHRAAAGRASPLRLAVAEAAISGKQVIVAEGISKSWASPAGEFVAVRDFSVRIQRGDRVGIVGPNGAGKTTLLRLLTGMLTPDRGEVRLGAALSLVTLDQMRATLDPERRLADTLTGGGGDTVRIGGESRHVVSYMKDFLFRPEQARTPVGVLSGGERGRLMLAIALARPGNLLVLDEPTNDLDLETLDLLQEMLAEHAATVLLVSHDRDFLDRVVTSTIAAEGDGRWVEYAGGYSDMLAQRATPPAAPPRRASKTAVPEAPTRAAASRKMTFRDQHLLKTLPERIAGLAAEIEALRAELADPDLFARSHARFTAAGSALAAAEQAHRVAEEQWLALEILREELEGSASR